MSSMLPADPETERLAKRIAEATGKPIARVVREAIEATAAAAGVLSSRRRSVDLGKVHVILAEIDALPVLDDRSPEEIIGYDGRGLPQ